MPKKYIELGVELFSFTSETQWYNKAQCWFYGISRGSYIAVDSAGRVCVKGKEFTRATNENTYPITVYNLLL